MTHSGAGEGLIGWLITVVIVAIYVAFLVRALTRPDRTAASRVAWVAAILLLPVLGPLAYLFLGETSIGRDRVARLKAAENHLIQPHARVSEPPAERVDMSPEETDLFNMLASVNGFAMTTGNTVDLQADSDAAVTSLVADIDAATTTIHLSFYIWLDDHNGRLVADAVTRAASRGVTCRILVDALGSRALLKTETWKRMAHAGARLAVALRDIPRFGNIAIRRVDLRNHRKIVVIDDAVAYCGSQNCADPAFLPKAKYAPWVDVFFRCTGPIVAQQQWLFLTTWVAETGEQFAADAVNDIPNAAGPVRGAMFGTGPSTRAGDMSDVFITVIQAARRTLTISTPYFVPDQPLLQALCAAPRRGVRTKLVLPAHNDSWLVAQAARSSYVALLEAGVEIYEYPLGLLHSKTMTIDDAFALVGSSNMDRRSLELNYENNLLVSDPAVTADVLARQQTYIDASAPVALGPAQQWSLGKRLVQNSVAMLSPIL